MNIVLRLKKKMVSSQEVNLMAWINKYTNIDPSQTKENPQANDKLLFKMKTHR